MLQNLLKPIVIAILAHLILFITVIYMLISACTTSFTLVENEGEAKTTIDEAQKAANDLNIKVPAI